METDPRTSHSLGKKSCWWNWTK